MLVRKKTSSGMPSSTARPKLILSALSVRRLDRIVQNWSAPRSADRRKSPASGISTTSDRYTIVYPRLRPKPGRTLRRRQRKLRAPSGAVAVMHYLAVKIWS